MHHPPFIHPNPAGPKTRKRSLALRASVLVASGAMAAAALAVAAPIRASAINLQPNLTLAAAPGSFTQNLSSNRKPKPTPTPTPTPTPPSAMTTGWNTTSYMATARVHSANALLLDGRVLVAGGTSSSSVELYTPSTGTWKAAASATIPMDSAAVTLPDGTVLVAGGSTDTQLYNPATNRWTPGPQMPDTGGALVFATLLPNGNAFFLDQNASEYNPNTHTWKTLATAPAMRPSSYYHSGDTTVLPNGDVLTLRAMQYASGVSGYGPTTGPGVYHWATDSWTMLPVAPEDPGDTDVYVTTLPNGNVMVTGGTLTVLRFMPKSVEVIMEVNPTTGAWTIDPGNFAGELVSLSNGTILGTGGVYDTDLDSVYNPTTQAWTTVPGRNVANATFTTLANGALLATGGYSDCHGSGLGTLLNRAHVYIP